MENYEQLKLLVEYALHLIQKTTLFDMFGQKFVILIFYKYLHFLKNYSLPVTIGITVVPVNLLKGLFFQCNNIINQ